MANQYRIRNACMRDIRSQRLPRTIASGGGGGGGGGGGSRSKKKPNNKENHHQPSPPVILLRRPKNATSSSSSSPPLDPFETSDENGIEVLLGVSHGQQNWTPFMDSIISFNLKKAIAYQDGINRLYNGGKSQQLPVFIELCRE